MKKLYHGSKEVIRYPEIRAHRFHKDFYWGFYCTALESQAARWAVRHGSGIVNVYDYEEQNNLNVLSFSEMNEVWLDFVISCRSGKPHDYDIVEGPMADDTIFNYIQNYLDGEISREAFWALAKFKYPTHQISFHTAKALAAISFERSYEVNGQTQ